MYQDRSLAAFCPAVESYSSTDYSKQHKIGIPKCAAIFEVAPKTAMIIDFEGSIFMQ